MRLSTLARLGATGVAVGIASYLPLASSVSSQPAGATTGWFFFSPLPHGACAEYGGLSETLYHAEQYGPNCESSLTIKSDVAIKENIVPVVW